MLFSVTLLFTVNGELEILNTHFSHKIQYILSENTKKALHNRRR